MLKILIIGAWETRSTGTVGETKDSKACHGSKKARRLLDPINFAEEKRGRLPDGTGRQARLIGDVGLSSCLASGGQRKP